MQPIDSNNFVEGAPSVEKRPRVTEQWPALENIKRKYAMERLAGNKTELENNATVAQHGIAKFSLNSWMSDTWKHFEFDEYNPLLPLQVLWRKNEDMWMVSVDYVLQLPDEQLFKICDLVDAVEALDQELAERLKEQLIQRLDEQRPILNTCLRQLFSIWNGTHALGPRTERQRKIERLLNLIKQSPQLSPCLIEHCRLLGASFPNSPVSLLLCGDTTLGGFVSSAMEVDAPNPEAQLRREVLQRLGIRPRADCPIGDKQLGLALGDSFVGGSGLDGQSYLVAINTFLSFRDLLPEPVQELLLQFKTTLGYTFQLLDEGDNRIDIGCQWMAMNVKDEGSVIFPCGWTNTKGGSHAMLVEVIGMGNCVNLRLYNQGAGVNRHDSTQSGQRIRRSAYREKVGVPMELVRCPEFWLTLTGFCMARGSEEEPYGSDDLYNYFDNIIPGDLGYSHVQILQQRAGSCTFSAILAFLKCKLSEKDYDDFILRFKFGILARYEEDLCYRRKMIEGSQVRFLREIREKLLDSVEVQRAIGRIECDLAVLLREYCHCDVMLIQDGRPPSEPKQLTSSFECPILNNTKALDGNREGLIKGKELTHDSLRALNGKRPNFINDPLKPFSRTAADLLQVIKGILERDEFQKLPMQLPSLCDVRQLLIDEQPDASDLSCAFLAQSLNRLTADTPDRRRPKPIIIAWVSELIGLIVALKLRSIHPEMKQFSLSAEAGKHPLERTESPLFDNPGPLNPGTERLLTDWLEHRAATADWPRPFLFIRNQTQVQGAPALRLSWHSDLWVEIFGKIASAFDPRQSTNPEMLLCRYFRAPKNPWPNDTSQHHNWPSRTDKEPLRSIASLLSWRAMHEEHAVLDTLFKDKGTMNITVKLNPGVCPTYAKIINATNSAPICLPIVGPDEQLLSMECDVEQISLLCPDESWTSTTLILDSEDAYAHGIPISQAAKRGVSSLTALLKGPIDRRKRDLARLQKLCEKVLTDHWEREELCLPLVRLVARVNLHGDEIISLNLNADTLARIKRSPNLSFGWACYLLSMQPVDTSLADALCAYRYLTIACGQMQNTQPTQVAAPFQHSFERAMAKSNRALNFDSSVWAEALNWYGVPPEQQANICQVTGATVIDGIIQCRFREWEQTPQGKVLKSLYPELAFSPWRNAPNGGKKIKKGEKAVPKTLVREWVCNRTQARIIQTIERMHYQADQVDQIDVSVNGEVLSGRLRALGLEDLVEIKQDKVYHLRKAAEIKELPSSLAQPNIEFWYTHEGSLSKKDEGGFIVDPVKNRIYLVERTTQRSNNCRVGIFDPRRENAELLTGELEYTSDLTFNWKNSCITVPTFGVTAGNPRIPVEVWAAGGGKNMRLWLSCGDGSLTFRVQRNGQNRLEYWCEEYDGYQWIPNVSCDDIGHMNGLLLVRGSEQIFICPLQMLNSEVKPGAFRADWVTKSFSGYTVLRRRLHPDFEPNDPEQSLFDITGLESFSLFMEQMMQRNWERARRYASAVGFSSINNDKALTAASQLIKPLPLMHPKARVLLLAAHFRMTEFLDDNGRYQFLNQRASIRGEQYLQYIDRYHLLERGWALTLKEEEGLAKAFDPSGIRRTIQNHLERVRGQAKPSKTEFLASFGASELNRDSSQISVPKNTAPGNDLQWKGLVVNLFRPSSEAKVFSHCMRLLSAPAPINERILEVALIWFSLRRNPSARVQLGPRLKTLLEIEIMKARDLKTPTQSASCLGPLQTLLSKTEPAETLAPAELKNCIEQLDIITGNQETLPDIIPDCDKWEDDYLPKTPPLPVPAPPALSQRQQERTKALIGKVSSREDLVDAVAKRIADIYPDYRTANELNPLGKRELDEEVAHAPRKAPRTDDSSQDLPSERFADLLAALDKKQDIKALVNQELDICKRQTKDLFNEIQHLHCTADKYTMSIGLRDLFTWLAFHNATGETNAEAQVAELLVRYAQASIDSEVLERVLDRISNGTISPFKLRGLLSCASIVQTPLPDQSLRYRIAACSWVRRLAFRPLQLHVLARAYKDKNLLAQLGCGDGKTFAIGPAIEAMSNKLVINVVPPGVFKDHYKRSLKDCVSTRAVFCPCLTCDRDSVRANLHLIQRALESAATQRVRFITTVSQLSALHLAHEWMLIKAPTDPRGKADAKILNEIYKVLQNSLLLLDEVDAAAKEQVHWTMGEQCKFGPTRSNIVMMLYESMIDLDNQRQQPLFGLIPGSSFDEDYYKTQGMHELINHLIDKNPPVFLGKVQIDSAWLKRYLSCPRGADKERKLVQEFKSIQSESVREDLMILRAQLQVYLPHTLKMRCNVNFGRGNVTDFIAIPYQAAQTPDLKSRFTYFDVIANLTTQLWLREPLPTESVIQGIALRLPKSNNNDLTRQAKRWLGPKGTISQLTKIVKRQDDWQELVNIVATSPLARLDIAAGPSINTIVLHTHMLQYTLATLESDFGNVIGLTATPYNHQGMDSRLAHNFLANTSMEESLERLSTCPVERVVDFSLKTLTDLAKSPDVHAFMDPEALVADHQNWEVAKAILAGARDSINFAVFWNLSKQTWSVIDRRGFIVPYETSRHSADACIVFFDQARSRGMDFDLPEQCSAYVLVGDKCQSTPLLQAAERCRLFKFGTQKVTYAVASNSKKFAMNNVDGNTVVRVAKENEEYALSEELPLMTKRKMHEVVRKPLIELLASSDDETRLILKEKYGKILLRTLDHRDYVEHASFDPALSIETDLKAYQAQLQTQAEGLITQEQIVQLSQYREDCIKALKNGGTTAVKPALDMRVQHIQDNLQSAPSAQAFVLDLLVEAAHHQQNNNIDLRAEAHHQQQVKSQEREERNKGALDERRCFVAVDVIRSLCSEVFPCAKMNTLSLGEKAFATQRLVELFPRICAPPSIWISDKLLSHIEAVVPRKLCGQEQYDAYPDLKLHCWATLGTVSHVLEVSKPKGHQTLFLALEEADKIAAALEASPNDPELAAVRLFRLDGQRVALIGNSEPLMDRNVLAVAALFNGELGPLSSEVVTSWIRDSVPPQDDCLKHLRDRLAPRLHGDPRHYDSNPIVKLFETFNYKI